MRSQVLLPPVLSRPALSPFRRTYGNLLFCISASRPKLECRDIRPRVTQRWSDGFPPLSGPHETIQKTDLPALVSRTL